MERGELATYEESVDEEKGDGFGKRVQAGKTVSTAF